MLDCEPRPDRTAVGTIKAAMRSAQPLDVVSTLNRSELKQPGQWHGQPSRKAGRL